MRRRSDELRERVDVSTRAAATTFVSLAIAARQSRARRSNEAFPLLHSIPFLFAVACGGSSSSTFDDEIRLDVEIQFGIGRACDAGRHGEAEMLYCPHAAHLSNSLALADFSGSGSAAE